MPPSEVVARVLYRALLRRAHRFDRSPVLASLIHRTGRADRWDPKTHGAYLGRKRELGGAVRDEEIPEDALNPIYVSPDCARDLSRGYGELRKSAYLRAIEASNDSHRDVTIDTATSPTGEEGQVFHPPHEILFRRLLLAAMESGGANGSRYGRRSPQMRFPSQIIESAKESETLAKIVEMEFRAPSLRDGSVSNILPVSSYFRDSARRDAAWLALRELNKKIAWAEVMGMDRKVLEGGAPDNGEETEKKYRRVGQSALDVHPLPTHSPSSYLRPGCFLVAHPLMPGYFSRSIIAIMEHTQTAERSRNDSKADARSSRKENEDGDLNQISSTGGTYGVIINRQSMISPTTGEDARPRPRALREVLRPDCLPDLLRRAFGDSPVREGGPVNVSVQMLHSASLDVEEKLRLGGDLLPNILSEDAEDVSSEQLSSASLKSDSAVYFNGDLMKSAQAVIDGVMHREDFSFVIGASVWSVGQLESEIERGFWIPVRGPPHMATSGMCDHQRDDEKGTRPKPDLWLSMMCAIGEGEAELAHLMMTEKFDENGRPCDDFPI